MNSQKWSDAAVRENREAGLLFNHRGVLDYFAATFKSDWPTVVKDPGETNQNLSFARRSAHADSFGQWRDTTRRSELVRSAH